MIRLKWYVQQMFMIKMVCQQKLNVFLVHLKVGALFQLNLKVEDLNDIFPYINIILLTIKNIRWYQILFTKYNKHLKFYQVF